MTFEHFQNRVVIEAKLKAITPIFIGARADSFKPGAINGSCVKDAYGNPYIPGSSLKGVLRAFAAAVSLDKRDKPGKSQVEAEFLKKEQRDEAVRIAKENDKNSAAKKYEGLEDDEILASLIVAKSTQVEMLFGSKVMAGKVKIADAIPIADRVTLEIRNGVAIDRDTRTAYTGALFDTEVVPAGTVFQFTVTADNLTAAEADLLGRLMEYFAGGGISVGGRSRAGLGKVELKKANVTIFHAVKDGFPKLKEIDCGEIGIREAICRCSRN